MPSDVFQKLFTFWGLEGLGSFVEILTMIYFVFFSAYFFKFLYKRASVLYSLDSFVEAMLSLSKDHEVNTILKCITLH